MDTIKEMVNQIEIQQLVNNSEHWVNIVHIDDPHNFYVRLTKHLSFVRKIETLKSVYKSPSVAMHQSVLFNMKRNSQTPKYARGQISNIEQRENCIVYNIFVIDYGHFESGVPFEHIWNCDPILLRIPGLAVKCQLGHCAQREGKWGEAIDAFKFYAGKYEQAKMIIEGREADKLLVLLYNTCPDDIATLLALSDYTTLGYVDNDSNHLQPAAARSKVLNVYKFKDLKTNVPLHVKVLSGKTFEQFYVADVNDYRKYLKNFNNITNYSKNQPKLNEGTIKNGDVVSIEGFENIFERGIIKEVLDSNKALVHMVDSGKNEVVKVTDMRKMPEHCMIVPVLAIYCSSGDIRKNPFRLLQPGNEFNITIKELGHGFQFPNIVKITKI